MPKAFGWRSPWIYRAGEQRGSDAGNARGDRRLGGIYAGIFFARRSRRRRRGIATGRHDRLARLDDDDDILRLCDGVREVDGPRRDDLVGVAAGFAALNITPGMQGIRAPLRSGTSTIPTTYSSIVSACRQCSTGTGRLRRAVGQGAVSLFASRSCEQGLIAAHALTIIDPLVGGG